MDTVSIFTDAATSSSMNIAVGAFLCLERKQLQQYAACSLDDLYVQLTDKVVYQKYHSKKSTWSEIKTAIDALNSIYLCSTQVVEIYTDCQSLCDLLGKRKERLLKNNFITRTGKLLQHADLYKELYRITEKFQLYTFKIKGHQKISNCVSVEEKIFFILDKLSRRKLRDAYHSP